MGVPGLFNYVDKPTRVAFSKLASDHYQTYGRKYRVAIDVSIWLFQVKLGRGGLNPEIRTLYYRLLRLHTLGVEPIFVFDGPGRPTEKRNKTTEVYRETPRAGLARSMLDAFGFIHHQAPGEAEAECARLQKMNIVDAVMSEDVDTLLFGAKVLLRNWASRDGRGRTSTHVDVYRVSDKSAKKQLDSEGMILFALVRGGDYDTVGIDRCGAQLAYEIATAGFGRDLCALRPDDEIGHAEWRERLNYELQINESGYFKTKHPKMQIKDNFPDKTIFGYYRQPLVSSDAELGDLKAKLRDSREPDITMLRVFVATSFGWDTLAGAKRLIRGLAPVVLTHQLLGKQTMFAGPNGLLSVCGNRAHMNHDEMPESRVEILPITLVPLDLENEPLHRPNDENDNEEALIDESESDGEELDTAPPSSQTGRTRSSSPAKRRAPSRYNPHEPEKLWVPEFYVRRGATQKFEAYEEAKSAPKQLSPRKPKAKGTLGKTGMREGAIESFFGVKKTIAAQQLAPPAKKARPVEPKRSQTDPDKPSTSNQQLTNLWAKTKNTDWRTTNPTWAEKQYYASVESQMRANKGSVHPDSTPSEELLHKSGLEARLGPEVSKQLVVEQGDHPSPISPQDLGVLASPDPEENAAYFSSPIASQDLLEVVAGNPQPETAAKRAGSNIRIRESLEGSWATTSPQGQRAGTKLRGVETVDLT